MLEHITEALAAEIAAGAITPEQVRALIHPRLDVVVVIYRTTSPDEVAEADAIQAERRKQC